MARWTGQTNFNSGVLTPRLNSRSDLELYFNGVSVGTNVLSMPHGGMRKRPGMKYHATMTQRSRNLPFEFNTEQTYVVALSDSRIDIYRDGALQTSITSSVPYSEAECFELDYAQSGDTMLLFHKDHQPRKIVRTSHTVWAISTVTLTNIPQYDFNDASSPTPVAEVQDLTFNTSFNNGDTYKLELEGIETDTITYSSSTSDNETRMADALQDLTNTGNSGISVAYVSGLTYQVTLDGESAKDWELIAGRAITIASSSAAIIVVADDTDGTARTEDVWSATRGWPRTGTFHEGRLWMGGSTERPSTLWGSRVFNFFDFKNVKARDDDGIDYTLDTDQINVIQHLVSGRALQVFTSGGEFYVPQSPITPSTISVRQQTRYGSKNIKPVIVDGATVFAQRTGTAIREFVYTESEQAYIADPINIRSPHLFNNVVDIATARGTSNEDANFVYVVNTDGTMAVFNTLRGEGISAWTKWETTGQIQSLCILDGVAWFCTERTINGSTVYYLEEAHDDHYLDASILQTQSDSTTVSNLTYLNGQAVSLRDGYLVLADVTPSSGTATAEASVTNPEAGLGSYLRRSPQCR